MSKITATIITFNEAARIEECIRSLDGVADEIVVIDSYSTDDTVAICERLGCSVRRRKFAGYGAQRQYATSLASHPYVLAVDADEVLSPALRASLIKLKTDGFTHRVYSFSRLNFYCGEPIKHCGWYPDSQIRLFDKRYAAWNLRDVQEQVIFRDSVRPEHIDGDILHFRCATHKEFASTERRHARIRGRVIAAQRDSISPLTPLISAIGEFLNCYILQGGILDGSQGRAISRERFVCALLSRRVARKLLKKEKAS